MHKDAMPPSTKEAFNTALELTAEETHYQDHMNKNQSSVSDKILQKPNQDNNSHATRLRAHMQRHNIAINESTHAAL